MDFRISKLFYSAHSMRQNNEVFFYRKITKPQEHPLIHILAAITFISTWGLTLRHRFFYSGDTTCI